MYSCGTLTDSCTAGLSAALGRVCRPADNGSGPSRNSHFSPDAQGMLAGDQRLQAGAAVEQDLPAGRRGCHLLEAVEHQEQFAFADMVRQRVNGLATHSGQPDVMNAARQSRSEPAGGLGHESGPAQPAHPDHPSPGAPDVTSSVTAAISASRPRIAVSGSGGVVKFNSTPVDFGCAGTCTNSTPAGNPGCARWMGTAPTPPPDPPHRHAWVAARLTRNLVEHACRLIREINELATRSAHSPNGLPGPCGHSKEGVRRPRPRSTARCSLRVEESHLWRLEEILVHVLSTPLAGIPGFRQMGSQVGRWPR
jgi:hypothetical protein